MSVVIAQISWVDTESTQAEVLVGLREAPFPGDTIKLLDGRRIRVIRREFNELASPSDSAQVDVILGVRFA